MSPEERQLLSGLFDRIRTAGTQPRDAEAEGLIADQVRAQPYAPYLLSQTVIVQEQALRGAAQRIEELQARNSQLEQDAQRAPAAGGFLGGLGSLFGGGNPPNPPLRRPTSVPPSGNYQGGGMQGGAPQQGWQQPPQQPPQGGPWGGQPQSGGFGQQQPPAQGGSFLKGALGAAAGVAGGVLLANSLSGLFHGSNNSLGIGNGFGGANPGGGSVTNNYYGNSDQSSADYAQDAQQDREDDARDQRNADYAQDAEQDRNDDVASADWGGGGGGDDGSSDA